jgi:hypothetical protein
MKKTHRKRLVLEREVLVRLAALPTANLKYVQGGTTETIVLVSSIDVPCSYSCAADGCTLDLC